MAHAVHTAATTSRHVSIADALKASERTCRSEMALDVEGIIGGCVG